MTLATKQRGENVVVPRLALPCPETGVRPDDVGSPTFRRQLTVALGRSHSQRTPRRDVIFRIHQGSMVEKKQKLPLEESVLAKTGRHYDGRGSAHRRASVADKVSATARCIVALLRWKLGLILVRIFTCEEGYHTHIPVWRLWSCALPYNI